MTSRQRADSLLKSRPTDAKSVPQSSHPFWKNPQHYGYIQALIEFIFKQFSSPMPRFLQKMATLLLEFSSVADPVRMDPHHGSASETKAGSGAASKTKAEPDLRTVPVCKWSQICIVLMRIRIRIEVKCRIRTVLVSKWKVKSGPHQSEKVDPDLYQVDADPQH